MLSKFSQIKNYPKHDIFVGVGLFVGSVSGVLGGLNDSKHDDFLTSCCKTIAYGMGGLVIGGTSAFIWPVPFVVGIHKGYLKLTENK